MKLNILISTYNIRITYVPSVLLPERDDVSYIISFQCSDKLYLTQIPDELKRQDVKISVIEGKGLSRNRNNAILSADGDIALIADDDVRYKPEYFDKIIEVFKNNPDTDVALFKIKTLDDKPDVKRYPQKDFSYKPFKGYYPSSIEMAFRVNSVKNKVSFDDRFGLGAERLNCGEEDVFIKDCLDAGLNVHYYPHYVVEHRSETTGKKLFAYTENIITKGAVSSYLHGWTSYFRMLKFSLVSKIKGRAKFWKVLYITFSGILYERRSRIKKRKR